MSKATSKSGLFRQVWNEVLAASEAAVAAHYRAPWSDVAPVARDTRQSIEVPPNRAHPVMKPCIEMT